MTILYWNIGNRIKQEVLQDERAEYGKEVIANLSKQLVIEYGQPNSEKNHCRIIRYAKVFPDKEIVASVMRQLSWTHFMLLLPLKTEIEREFYAQMCRIEKWSVL